MAHEYQIKDWSGRWYIERLRSPGVWDIIGEHDTKEEAEAELQKIKESEVR